MYYRLTKDGESSHSEALQLLEADGHLQTCLSVPYKLTESLFCTMLGPLVEEVRSLFYGAQSMLMEMKLALVGQFVCWGSG